MKINVVTLDNQSAGDLEIRDDIFCVALRRDLLARVVRWQLSRKRSGSAKTKGRSEVHYTTRKMFRQKGTGNARHGNAAAPQFRHGGRAFGPIPRSYAFSLPKKVRALALKVALSMKLARGDLIVIDNFSLLCSGKTKELFRYLKLLDIKSSLWIKDEQAPESFFRASRNIPLMDVLPVQGLNVYSILRRKKLVFSRRAMSMLEERFS